MKLNIQKTKIVATSGSPWGFPDSSADKDSACNAVVDPVQFLGQEEHWKRERLPTPVFSGFPCGSAGKESTSNVIDLGSIPGLEKHPGEGKEYPLQYSGLENSMECTWGPKELDMTE